MTSLELDSRKGEQERRNDEQDLVASLGLDRRIGEKVSVAWEQE